MALNSSFEDMQEKESSYDYITRDFRGDIDMGFFESGISQENK